MPRLSRLPSRLRTIDSRLLRVPEPEQGQTAGQRYNAQRRRDSETARLYGTRRWKALRAEHLSQEPLCRMCAADGRVTPAVVCDHIEPHRGDVALFWAGPFQSLCTRHHNGEKQREERAEYLTPDYAERRLPSNLQPSCIPLTIVCGPPGSGKSTYIRERIGPRDLLIDLDRIMSGFSGMPEHHTSSEWLAGALDERNRMLRSLSIDRTHDRVWFIVGAPDPVERTLWQARLGGDLVVLAVPVDECLRRIRADPTRAGHTERMEKAARAWWAMNTHLAPGWGGQKSPDLPPGERT